MTMERSNNKTTNPRNCNQNGEREREVEIYKKIRKRE